MKKALLLICLLFVLIGCSSNEEKNAIDLTIDNYSLYLDLSGQAYGFGNEETYGFKDGKKIVCDDIAVDFLIKGNNQNCKYKDVIVTVLVTGTYTAVNSEYWKANDIDFSSTLVITCDTLGNGKNTAIVEKDSYYESIDYTRVTNIVPNGYAVIDIKGKVIPNN